VQFIIPTIELNATPLIGKYTNTNWGECCHALWYDWNAQM